jgi:hypothetical protein
MAHQRIEKWRGWIDGPIKDEVLTMHLHRDTWSQTRELVRKNTDLPDSYWWEFLGDTYAVTQAVAVRRQIDVHKDVASLGKLISEVAQEPHIITRAFWISLWDTSDPVDVSFAERAWRKQFGGSTVEYLDPAIPRADLVKAEDLSSGVKQYVDKHLAHSDRKPVPANSLPTLADVHAVIDLLGHLFKKYSNLLTAVSWGTLVPVLQHDWKAPFREPWIRSA